MRRRPTSRAAWRKTPVSACRPCSARYTFTTRDYSDALVAQAIAELTAEYPADNYPSVDDFNNGRAWNTSPVIGAGFGGPYCWQSLIAERCAETTY